MPPIQAHFSAPNVWHLSESSTYYRLSDDVLIVPIVVISWIYPGGSQSAQDQRWELQAAFDYIPFYGSKLDTIPDDWLSKGWRQPETPYFPPDDIFAQCGIQFQVVEVFMLQTQGPLSSQDCNPAKPVNVFASDTWRDTQLQQALGLPEYQALVTLDPIDVEVGHWTCSGFSGKGSDDDRQVQIEKGYAGVNLAHELGHILIGDGHYNVAGNLMKEGAYAETGLVAGQCATARQNAAFYSQRFRDYNISLGRVRQDNPLIPSIPEAHGDDPKTMMEEGEVCCEFNGDKFFAHGLSCLGSGGSVRPLAQCTECCLLSQPPPTVEYQRLGSCDGQGTVIERKQCATICCQLGSSQVYLPRYECLQSGGYACLP